MVVQRIDGFYGFNQRVPGALPLAILISPRWGFKTFKKIYRFLYLMQSGNAITQLVTLKAQEKIRLYRQSAVLPFNPLYYH
ncbi:MAG: hypothetical protein DRR19_03970 [Candidatus Parabeggiatoa sp. nov. 1]|nr:MAG: hypothetical protein DRR19_03970 [Gammaproteobacteria bacterium]